MCLGCGGLRTTVQEGADGGNLNEFPDKDEGDIPDTASDIHDGDHWDDEGKDHLDNDHLHGENSNMYGEDSSDSDSQHDSETDSVLSEVDEMYGDTFNVERTSFD